MSAKQLLIERHQKRTYYASLMRTTCIALVAKDGDKFPWEKGAWQQSMPELSAFLCNPSSEFNGSQEDYNTLLLQFSQLAEDFEWLNKYFHEFAEKDQSKYLPSKPIIKEKIGYPLLIFTIGAIVGVLFF